MNKPIVAICKEPNYDVLKGQVELSSKEESQSHHPPL